MLTNVILLTILWKGNYYFIIVRYYIKIYYLSFLRININDTNFANERVFIYSCIILISIQKHTGIFSTLKKKIVSWFHIPLKEPHHFSDLTAKLPKRAFYMSCLPNSFLSASLETFQKGFCLWHYWSHSSWDNDALKMLNTIFSF